MKLVCSECGQGDFEWSWNMSARLCEVCRKITKWITFIAYKKKKDKK